ncbi:MAG: PSD1 and planctomycete cytochrome C domain-containing protein [Pirellulales bacterium]
MAVILAQAMFAGNAARGDEAYFRDHVAPVLERHCVRCHQGDEPKGGLSLVDNAKLQAGGESGPAVVPGKPDESLLVTQISGAKPEMPMDAPALAAEEVAAVRRWVAEGAAWPAGLVLADKRPTDVNWWSLVPLAEVAVPDCKGDVWPRSLVDAFILATLRAQRMSPAAEADRRTLIRRLTYDLHGLPPTPAEVDAFLADARPDAYERLVDRLLASPRYGERWGRHWLDVVHYGESHGYDKDKPRPNAWPYRDYVIDSLNGDKPYDRFVAEQIAGDVLWPGDSQAITATGFIAAGPWDFVGHCELREGTVDKDIARSNDRDDMVATVMSTFTSLTVHCARCHDHKFDPIRQQDYYALQAVFAGVERADRPYRDDPAVESQRAELQGRKQQAEKQLALARQAAEAAKAGADKSDAGQPNAAAIAMHEQAIKELDAQLAALPARPMVYAAANQFAAQGSFAPPASPRPIYLLVRGDVRSRGPLVEPAAVACVQGPENAFALADSANEGERRAALARWLVDPPNALVRRSIVNRVWQYHFGQGLVDTPNDFGRMGSLPTHPELLEWLAGWFMDHGHSLKALHRLLLTSAVYRQASVDNAEHATRDAGNRYLWRMNRARLDAECLRDAMLAVSGRLDTAMGGPSVQQFFFKDDHSPIYDYGRFEVDDPRGQRRSVYRFLVRSVPDPFMECLDCADPSIMTPRRNTTLTSIQALALLNNPFCVRQAEHFAARLEALHAERASQIDAAYRLALARPPGAQEAAAVLQFAERFGLAAACRVIFNSNEFVFVD